MLLCSVVYSVVYGLKMRAQHWLQASKQAQPTLRENIAALAVNIAPMYVVASACIASVFRVYNCSTTNLANSKMARVFSRA